MATEATPLATGVAVATPVPATAPEYNNNRNCAIACIITGIVLTFFAGILGVPLLCVGGYLYSGLPGLTLVICIQTIPFVLASGLGALVALGGLDRYQPSASDPPWYHAADITVETLWIVDTLLGLTATVLGIVGTSKLLCCPIPFASTASVNLWGFRFALSSAFPMVVAAVLVAITGGPCARASCGMFGSTKSWAIMAAVWTPTADGILAYLLYRNYQAAKAKEEEETPVAAMAVAVGLPTKLDP